MNLTKSILTLTLLTGAAMANAADEDPYLWLEDVEGAKALDWVKARNAESQKALEADPTFKRVLGAVKTELDPNWMLNPGLLLDRPKGAKAPPLKIVG